MHSCNAKQETVKGIHNCTPENIKWARYLVSLIIGKGVEVCSCWL
jgi:hypothetical protein